MAYFVAHFVFSDVAKKQKKGPKSNKETPKNISRDPLRSLRVSSDYSLEFPYCFLTQILGISSFVTLNLRPCSDSGGPSLPFGQNGPELKS